LIWCGGVPSGYAADFLGILQPPWLRFYRSGGRRVNIKLPEIGENNGDAGWEGVLTFHNPNNLDPLLFWRISWLVLKGTQRHTYRSFINMNS
jgi:hypothetical protein